MEERAPSTAEEFERVAEEKKAKEAQKGVASQSIGKAIDGAEEASLGKSKVESVKNRYKGHEWKLLGLVTTGGTAVSWKSKLQDRVALSTTESEYITISVPHDVYIQPFPFSIGIKIY